MAEKSTVWQWQRHWDMSDAQLGACLRVSARTVSRWRAGDSKMPHEMLIRAVNVLKVPGEDALDILTAGCPAAIESTKIRRSKKC